MFCIIKIVIFQCLTVSRNIKFQQRANATPSRTSCAEAKLPDILKKVFGNTEKQKYRKTEKQKNREWRMENRMGFQARKNE